ncbi:hypothetical protein PsorP6_009916 [Peronosclerospora sorghi]|uniref:Uncharacterized protein n=1 Tax=Peronosclerospora sorghi TaxID=230839 RepID=A0ACC0VZV5_9STRA|nr:hypothetical protein PsorP6_009916 [Peronosclerospora sorghi]
MAPSTDLLDSFSFRSLKSSYCWSSSTFWSGFSPSTDTNSPATEFTSPFRDVPSPLLIFDTGLFLSFIGLVGANTTLPRYITIITFRHVTNLAHLEVHGHFLQKWPSLPHFLHVLPAVGFLFDMFMLPRFDDSCWSSSFRVVEDESFFKYPSHHRTTMRIVVSLLAFFIVLASAQTWEELEVNSAEENLLTEILSTEKYYNVTMRERACWSSMISLKRQVLTMGSNFRVRMQGCLSESLGKSNPKVGHCDGTCKPKDLCLSYYYAPWVNDTLNIQSINPANEGDC